MQNPAYADSTGVVGPPPARLVSDDLGGRRFPGRARRAAPCLTPFRARAVRFTALSLSSGSSSLIMLTGYFGFFNLLALLLSLSACLTDRDLPLGSASSCKSRSPPAPRGKRHGPSAPDKRSYAAYRRGFALGFGASWISAFTADRRGSAPGLLRRARLDRAVSTINNYWPVRDHDHREERDSRSRAAMTARSWLPYGFLWKPGLPR